MNYFELHFHISPVNATTVNNVLAADLGEIGFESFTDSEDGMLAYIPENLFDETTFTEQIPHFLYGSTIRFTKKLIPDQDWNIEWEKNYFKPIIIDKSCVIHSSFQSDVPAMAYDILINPKMAFGSGHHETTSMMLSELLKLDVKNKSFLDMGCGTAVFSILASLKGASSILGIDIDEWAFQNALENIKLNKTFNVEILLGGAELLENSGNFDFIFANINRNILLQDMKSCVTKMISGSQLFMSGFYKSDIPVIQEKAESLGLKYKGFITRNDWGVVHFLKC